MKTVIYGDSLLRGVICSEEGDRYHIWDNPFPARLREKYGVEILNRSVFGCTAPRGLRSVMKALERGLDADYVLIEYGGNDSNYHWEQISAAPEAAHQPLTELTEFTASLERIVKAVREAGAEPVICVPPPIDAEKYFAWFSRELDGEALRSWLADIRIIYRHQELYALQAAKTAARLGCRIIDLRAPLLNRHDYDALIGPDGLHPTAAGYELIWESIEAFFREEARHG